MRREHGECLDRPRQAINDIDARTESRSVSAKQATTPVVHRMVASFALCVVAALACHLLIRTVSPGILDAADLLLGVATLLTILEVLDIPAWRFVGSWIWLLVVLIILKILHRYKSAPPA
ncbi:hypothetical protein [Caballeronia sp. LZ043]|uniref:hypothetical protein n=1 Tax=Caballeronia sp. LZ043 TaxID=3038569 RepID=UPI00285D62E4|nr:hypothetical protein [Caballeronia sp. LZ043]MDR5826169.1 hypothetical protein [Caballeronia sp. LZ043]